MVKTHRIRKPQAKTYAVACNPLLDIYHTIEIESNQGMDTGQPVVVYGTTKADVYGQLFSAYTLDDDGNLDTYTERETTFSVDYTQEDAEATVADVQDITDGIMVRPLKHPDRDEWALIVSTHIIQGAKNGTKKDALMDKHLDKINEGKNKSKAQAKADGWK